jgi:hypothetical protein
MAEEKRPRHHREYHDTDDMTEFEKYMAMKWGTPKGIATLLGSLSDVFIGNRSVFVVATSC